MITTFCIIAVSLALFFYWFRSIVILLLQTPSVADCASKVAQVNRLSFPQVRQQLQESSPAAKLSNLQEALESDYRVLKYLLGHGATVTSGGYTTEQRALMLNFRVMAVWLKVALRFRPESARRVLLELAETLNYFATVAGRRTAAATVSPASRS